MSEEEKKRRLEEMQKDAEKHEEQRWKRIKTEKEFDKIEEQNLDKNKNKHTFINDMNRSIYTEHNDTLEDRVKRNIHTLQRNSGTALIHEEGGLK